MGRKRRAQNGRMLENPGRGRLVCFFNPSELIPSMFANISVTDTIRDG